MSMANHQMTRRTGRAPADAGFSLVEMLVALTLTGLVLSALAAVTAQWLPNWRRGLSRISDGETLALAMDRMAADLSSALFVPAHTKSRKPFFAGTTSSVIFVRTALGPNVQPGLEIVHFSAGGAGGVVRSAASFAPRLETADLPAFGAPAALLDPRFRVSFSYAGSDGLWLDAWLNAIALPRAVRIVLRDARTGRALDVSSAVVIRAELPARCATNDRAPPCTPPAAAASSPRTAVREGDKE
ncbi:prepilin-type N-terminal cleavage/methylation domain-containing protein [Xanthobacter oligotrophicus]|uniref:Prepilin-type N-terminal cleavage/methylation domain-containing protein n=1 Tax=Xanthobacter oligotrophicus TaxID=2607286 RepID=A0ABW7A297_9HYPH